MRRRSHGAALRSRAARRSSQDQAIVPSGGRPGLATRRPLSGSPTPCWSSSRSGWPGDRPGRGQAFRADQGHVPPGHTDLTLAVPDGLSGVPGHPVYPDTITLPSAAALFQGTGGALRRWTARWPTCCAATSCTAGTRRGLFCCCHCWRGWAAWPPAAASAGPRWPACWSPGRASWCSWAPTSTSSPGVTSSPPWSRSRSRARSGPASCRPGSAAAPGGAPSSGGPPPAPQIRQ